eukprot:TRINITY_DN193_c0_g1_i2.p1 TRINITY_DN193_c0_g1~~TRINITY_DN193_c0_g1_i2.p1  ORF type:complete len:398 (+),score=107.06 TRINITY_DN193_c0_g1_i2:88-1281(+)
MAAACSALSFLHASALVRAPLQQLRASETSSALAQYARGLDPIIHLCHSNCCQHSFQVSSRNTSFSCRASALTSSTTEAKMAVSVPATHKAWSYSSYGGPVELSLGELPVPEIGSDEVLVKVHAAALNPVDIKRLQGKFQQSDSPLPTIPGYDVAGVVVKVGENVTKFNVGDEVFGDLSEHAVNRPRQFGSLAEYAVVEEKLLAKKPSNISFAEAAALPLVLLTANEGFERVQFKEGESVLIVNGAGGVGHVAIQVAKAVYNAGKVVATASASKADILKSLGADEVYDYKSISNYSSLPEKFDFVFDAFGDGGRSCAAAKKEGGRVAVLTGPVPGNGFRYVLISNGAKLQNLVTFIESGQIRPLIDSTFGFEQVKEAFEKVASGRATGKVVIAPISS